VAFGDASRHGEVPASTNSDVAGLSCFLPFELLSVKGKISTYSGSIEHAIQQQ
jgi:hypothetical protein